MAPDLTQLKTATAFLCDGWHYTPAGQPWALVTREGDARRVYVWPAEDPRPDSEQLRRLFRLTPMQARVTRMLMTRRTNNEIAAQLRISIHTARRHVEAVLLRTEAKSRWDVEQVVYAALAKVERRNRREVQKRSTLQRAS
jgi:DNA-binding CsgD family transcriptional regulator